MFGRLFTLVTTDDDTKVFAWGMEITTGDDVEAVIYRKDPATARTLFGVHDSAQAACDRWSAIVPVEICWEDEDYPLPASVAATTASPASSSGRRPRPLVTV